MVEDPDVDKLRTTPQKSIGLMRGHNFGWKAFWDSNPEWSCLKLMIDQSWKNLAALHWKSMSCTPPLRDTPWHLTYN